MDAKDIIRLPDPRKKVAIDVREALHDVDGTPHVLIRVRLTGWHFPQRAQVPFLLVGDAVSKGVVIDRDGLGANAYFDQPLPAAKRVSFGYGNVVAWDFDLAVEPDKMPRLDRKRLPPASVDPFSRTKRPG